MPNGNRITLTAVAEKMVNELISWADRCDVNLDGITYENFNLELDGRFNDGGEARCEYFCDLGWEYAARFGELGSDPFEKAQHDAVKAALALLPVELEKRNKT